MDSIFSERVRPIIYAPKSMGALAGGVGRSTEKDRVYLIAVGLLFVELLAGVVWGIQRGLSSLFAREVLMIVSFTQIGMVTSVFGLTKAVTNLFMGALSDRVGRKPVIVVGAIVSALGGMVIASDDDYAMGIRKAAVQGYRTLGAKPGATMIPRDERQDWSFKRHDRLGYNFRMSAVQAALGLAQLERPVLPLDYRSRRARRYVRAVSSYSRADFFE